MIPAINTVLAYCRFDPGQQPRSRFSETHATDGKPPFTEAWLSVGLTFNSPSPLFVFFVARDPIQA